MTTRFPRIRRTVPGVVPPLVQLATKARTQREHDRRAAAFHELADDSQIAVIQRLVDGDISWEQIIDTRRRGELKGAQILTTIGIERPLVTAIRETLPEMGNADATRARYAVTLSALERSMKTDRALWFASDDPLAGDKSAPVRVRNLLAVQWPELHAQWRLSRSASDWNHVARLLSSFLTVHLGNKHHPFALEVRGLMPRDVEDERVPDLTPAVFWRVFDAAPEHVRAQYLALLLLGCRVRQEYLKIDAERQLMPERMAVRFKGTGSSKSKRGRVVTIDPEYWPWVEAAIASRPSYRTLYRHWTATCVAVGAGTWTDPANEREYVGLNMHDLRHALGQWASDAGVPLDRVSDVLGHSDVATTARYTRVSSSNQVSRAAGEALRRAR